MIRIGKNSKLQAGWVVSPEFAIHLHGKDIKLLSLIQSHFGSGTIRITKSDGSILFSVRSLADITNKIIPHFDKYPLITQKRADFLLLKSVVELINRKEHLTEDGLRKIIGIKASINRGLSEKLKIDFPNVTPISRPLVEDQKIKDPNWLAGFTEGEGYFLVDIYKSSSVKSGFAVKLKFSLAQHSPPLLRGSRGKPPGRDEKLLKSFYEYLGCGYYYERPNRFAGDFIVTKYADLTAKIIPFFNNYPLVGAKRQDYLCQVAELMKTKAHLTASGRSNKKNKV
jgi:hypothetical protein